MSARRSKPAPRTDRTAAPRGREPAPVPRTTLVFGSMTAANDPPAPPEPGQPQEPFTPPVPETIPEPSVPPVQPTPSPFPHHEDPQVMPPHPPGVIEMPKGPNQ